MFGEGEGRIPMIVKDMLYSLLGSRVLDVKIMGSSVNAETLFLGAGT